MENIKAFIGHSFSPEDEPTVRKFLDFFNAIKQLGISFSWDHAEKAEPEILSNKVMQKMKSANTFIGICTKKERVLEDKNFNKYLFSKYYKLCDTDYKWKTSDWILQEIGCAFGREMKIILLVEKELRDAGGLQGNLEYIEFERKEPEKVFKKILEMIEDLIPGKEKETIIEKDQKVRPEIEEVKELGEEKSTYERIEINGNWEYDDYRKALVHTIIHKKNDDRKELEERFKLKFEKEYPENVIIYTANALFYDFAFNNVDVIEDMKKLIFLNPKIAELQNLLALICNKCDQPELAEKYYLSASENSIITEQKLENISSAAIINYKNQKQDYKNYINQMVKIDSKNEHTDIIYKTVAEIEKNRHNLIYCLCMEARLNNKPLNQNDRFSLAYKYSEINMDQFSFYHYNFLVNNDHNDPAYLNNLGVAAIRLNLQGRGTQFYQRSADLNNTLAMSNIAYKYIKEGFFDEAEAICKKATEQKEYDKEVLGALTSIKYKKGEEEKIQKEIIENVKIKRSLMSKLSIGLLFETITELNLYFQHPKCKLELKINNGMATFYGSYMHKPISSFLFKSLKFNQEEKEEIEYEIEIKGEIIGHIIEGTYVDAIKDQKTEDKKSKEKEVLVLFDEGLKNVEVYEKISLNKMFDLISIE